MARGSKVPTEKPRVCSGALNHGGGDWVIGHADRDCRGIQGSGARVSEAVVGLAARGEVAHGQRSGPDLHVVSGVGGRGAGGLRLGPVRRRTPGQWQASAIIAISRGAARKAGRDRLRVSVLEWKVALGFMFASLGFGSGFFLRRQCFANLGSADICSFTVVAHHLSTFVKIARICQAMIWFNRPLATPPQLGREGAAKHGLHRLTGGICAPSARACASP